MVTNMLYGGPFRDMRLLQRRLIGSPKARLHREPAFRPSTSMLVKTGSSSRPNCPACETTTIQCTRR